MNTALGAIGNSFIIGLIVAALDLLAGVPLAWLITRGKSRWLTVLDTLADLPFVVPTAALGYSLLLFWSSSGGISDFLGNRLFRLVGLLVMLLHFTFSFPCGCPRHRRCTAGLQDGIRTCFTHPWRSTTNRLENRNVPNHKALTNRSLSLGIRPFALRNRRNLHRCSRLISRTDPSLFKT